MTVTIESDEVDKVYSHTVKPYCFAKYPDGRTDVKPDNEITRLLERVMADNGTDNLTRAEKDRVANILYGVMGAGGSTYKLGGWAWPMGMCLPIILVRCYGNWSEYYAPDKTSLRKALSIPVDKMVYGD